VNKLSYAFLAVACVAALTFATGAQAQPAGPQMSPEDKPYPPPGTALGETVTFNAPSTQPVMTR